MNKKVIHTNYDKTLLEQVVSFILAMSKEELRLAKKYLNFYQRDSNETQLSKLYHFLLQHPDTSTTRLYIELNESPKGLENILKRLLSKLEEMVMSEFNMGQQSVLNLRTKIDYEIRTKSLLAEVCLTRGLPKHAIRLIEGMLEKALHIEDYAHVNRLLNLKIQFYHHRNGNKDYQQLSSEISKYQSYDVMLAQTKELFAAVSSKSTSYAVVEDYSELREAVATVERFYAITQSHTIAHYLYQLQFIYHSAISDYHHCLQAGFNLLRLDKQIDFLNTKQYMGISNLYIGSAYLGLGSYTESLQYLEIAQQHFYVGSFNYCLTEEVEFYAYFYNGDYDLAEKKINTIRDNPNYTKSNYMDNKKDYLYAYVLYALGKYDQAIRTINLLHEIPKDKTGWNIGIRYLQAMLAIEVNDYDLFMKNLRAYERDLMRIKKAKQIRPRENVIHRIFQTLGKEYSFEKAKIKRADDLLLLQSTERGLSWQVHSHELIPIDEWFEAKYNAQKRQIQSRSK